MSESKIFANEFNGLTSAQPILPYRYYFDDAQYRRELENIWARNWVDLCRAEILVETG